MNEQQFFNEAYTHIMQQGEPAVTAEGGTVCRYLTSTGLMCAFSIALIDDDARRMCEGISAHALLTDPEHAEKYIKPEYRDLRPKLASAVQSAHDRATVDIRLEAGTFTQRFHRNMVSIAEDFNLDIPTIKKEQE